MSSLVCGLDIHKDSVYATMMSYGGKVVDRRRLSNDEVVGFPGRYPIDKVAMESSTSIVPVYRALRERVRDTRLASQTDQTHRGGTHQDRSG